MKSVHTGHRQRVSKVAPKRSIHSTNRLHTNSFKHQQRQSKRSIQVSQLFSNKSTTQKIPLNEPLPNMPFVEMSARKITLDTPRIATLSNGIRVITQNSTIPVSTIAISVEMGSRFESEPHQNGLTHFLERSIIRSTSNRLTSTLIHDLGKLGADISTSAGRDNLMMTAVTPTRVNPVLGAMADVIKHALYHEHDVNGDINLYIQENNARKELYDVLLGEAMMEAAFGKKALGRPLYASNETLAQLTPKQLKMWHKKFLTADRLAIAATGVDHDSFIALADEMFGDILTHEQLIHQAQEEEKRQEPATVTTVADQSELQDNSLPIKKEPVTHRTLQQEHDLALQHASLNDVSGFKCSSHDLLISPEVSEYHGDSRHLVTPGYEGLTHILLGWNAPSMGSTNVVAANVFQTVLGGGMSFSSGGPGKGMYSRFYRNILCEHPWVESISSWYSPYTDAGLLGVYGIVPPTATGYYIRLLQEEMNHLTHSLTEAEVERAKNLTKSALQGYIDNQTARTEEMARHVQLFGEYRMHDFISQIDKLTTADICQVATEILSQPVSVVTHGDVTLLPQEITFSPCNDHHHHHH